MNKKLTKKDKYQKLYDTLIPILTTPDLFDGMDGKPLILRMESIYDITDAREINDFQKTGQFECEYHDYLFNLNIRQLLRFTEKLLNDFVKKPFTYKDGTLFQGTGVFDIFAYPFLAEDEEAPWSRGSNFTCHIENHIIVKKHQAEETETGEYIDPLDTLGRKDIVVSRVENFDPEIALMGEGIYSVESWSPDEMFVIREEVKMILKNIKSRDEYYPDSPIIANFKNHPLKVTEDCVMTFHDPKHASNHGDEGEYMISEDIDECSRCGGGGCPSCDTTGFFTGIRVYD